MVRQSEKRIIIKTITYRFLGIFFTLIFSYLFTKSIKKSFKIALFTESFQTLLYFIYENCWNGTDYGMERSII
jgi:uncharacterized membrane protein